MKKLIYCALALAAGLFASSCQQENLEPVAGGNTVTYTVELPGVDTKAIGDGLNINQLVYEVWRTENPNDVTLEPGAKTELLYRVADKLMDNGSTIIELDLVNDQNYTILFWAQVRDGGYYNTEDLRKVTLTNKSSNAFEENRAAFYGVDFINATDQRKVKQTVTLTRPFGQVNLGTEQRTPEQQAVYELKVVKTAATVKGASAVFNVATGVASATERVDMEFTAVTPLLSQKLNDEYQWISMNYVFVPANQATFEVDYTIETNHGDVTNTISNIPAKKNYRTNIVGNLLTSKTEYTVNLDTRWDGADFNTTVIEEGIVVNANGDYEVSTPHGLAYMLNNLFKENHVLAEGGNFYLTAAEYDMTDMIVESPSVPADKTLNIYGETPVVTRSTTGYAGITIKGLTQPLIGTVSGEVSVSGVTVTAEKSEEVSVLIKEIAENATVVVSEVVAEKIAETGKDNILYADDVKDFDSLKAALKSDIKVIDITADFDANEAIVIDRSITINGKGNTLTSSYNRVINFTAPGINVEINDWSFISTAARNGNNGPRGLNIWGPEVHDAILTFNNCSVDFTDPSANDWTYAINCGVNENNTITINGGTYEGANVVNVWGANHTITIDGAVLTSLYQPSYAYYGFCVSLQEAENSIATIKNSTLNSVHAKAFGGTTKNEFILENNTDNTQVYPFFIGNAPYLTLNEAFDAAENNTTIYAPFNAEISSSTVPSGKKVTLVLQNQATEYKTQLTGTDESTGSFALINVNPGADLTITGPGSIKLSATNDREWNAYSSVVSNQRGTLTVNGGATIEHLGGTAMAYGIDNLTNGKGTSAVVTIEDATVKSVYRAVRQFLNGVEATNELYVKAGAHIESVAKEDGSRNKSIWMQDANKEANNGQLVVEEGAELYGDVYLSVTAGSTEWPVSASIPTSTLMNGSKVLTGNLPEGYSVEEKNGVYEVTYKSPAQASLEAQINEGGEVVLTEDIELSSPIEIKDVTVTLDLNGKTITAPYISAFKVMAGGELTVKNGKVVAYESTVRAIGGKVTVESGEYTSTGTALDSPSTYRYSLDCREGGELIINGGTFKSNNGLINVGSTVTINGGKFENIVEKTMTRHLAYVSALLTINDGEFYGKANSSAGGCFFCGAAKTCDIQVKGGKFTSLWTSGSVNRIFESYAGGSKINVTGGMFNTNGGIATFVTENTDEATKAAYPYVAK